MTDRSQGIPEGVQIAAVTSADFAAFREIAALGILSWGREPIAMEVEELGDRFLPLPDEMSVVDDDDRRHLLPSNQLERTYGLPLPAGQLKNAASSLLHRAHCISLRRLRGRLQVKSDLASDVDLRE